MKFEIKANLHRKDEAEAIEMQTTLTPPTIIADSTGIPISSHDDSVTAKSCIYCESQDQLSNEHIIPYALGGVVQVLNGSCEKCRQVTQHFENLVLRGEMQSVRYLKNLPSRSKHKNARSTIPVRLEENGKEIVQDVKISEAPILLSYPLFSPPKLLTSKDDSSLDLMGLATTSHGVHPDVFLSTRKKDKMNLTPPKLSPMAFARMVAKIAYGFAWSFDILNKIANPKDLPEAIINTPAELGKFVGTQSEPYKIFPELLHRVQIHSDNKYFYAEVQLFAASGAPTYLVVLGATKPEESI